MALITTTFLLISAFLGNILKYSFFSPDVHLTSLDISIIIATLAIIISRPGKYLQQMKKLPHVTGAQLIFLILALVSLGPVIGFYGLNAVIVGFFYWLRLFFYSLFAYALASVFTTRSLNKLIFGVGLALVVTGAVQYLVFPDIRSLQIAEWDPHYYRVVGTLLDPGFMGIMLIMFMLYLLSHPLSNRLYNYLLLFISYVIFALTYSRSSYLALLAVAGSFSITRHSWRPFVFTFLLLLFTFTILPRSPDGEGVKLERTSSITARITNWKQSLQIIQAHPVLGVGYNVYRYAQKQAGFMDDSKWLKSHAGAGADSSLLFITATTGIIGLALFLNYLRSLLQQKIGNHELVGLLVHSLFLNSLFYPFVLFWLAFLLALGLVAKENS